MKEILEIFKKETGYDIKSYFEDFVLFCNTYYPLLVGYYTGSTDIDIKSTFIQLDNLLKQSEKIEPLFTLKQNSLPTISAWELLDFFTECQTKLWTINNSSKWFRSAIIGRYGSNVVLNRVLKTRENFEDVSSDLGFDNPQDEWFNIAKNNYVREEDYDAADGGGMFKINIASNGNLSIDNIVDNLTAKNILGKDIDINFRIENGDICTVEYEKAVEQAFNIMISCLKGSIPEFPEYGISNDLIGGTVKAIQYPTIFRNLLDMFQRDGRWVEVNLLDLYRQEDNLFLKISAKTVTDNSLTTNIQI